jgi:hypothetical protein
MSIIPWMHEGVVNMLKNVLSSDTKILEFGSGNSTLFYSKYTNNIYSVEHDKTWYNKISKKLDNKIVYKLIEIDYVSKPSTDLKFYNSNSVEEIFEMNIPDEYFDIIIIDGIHRVNCAYGSIKKLKKGGILILDDTNRIENPVSDGSYMPIKNLVKDWEEHIFRTPGGGRNTDYWIKP